MAKNRPINQRPVTPGVHADSPKPESDRLLGRAGAYCSALIDVFQEFDPEFILCWREGAADLNACPNAPVTSCPQARTEVLRMYPGAAPAGVT